MNRSGSATLLRLKIGIIEQAAIATAFKFGDHLVVIIRHVQAAPVVAVLPPTEAPRNRASLSRRGQPCVKRRRPLPKAGSGADALASFLGALNEDQGIFPTMVHVAPATTPENCPTKVPGRGPGKSGQRNTQSWYSTSRAASALPAVRIA